MIHYRCQGHKPFGDTVDQAMVEGNKVTLSAGFRSNDDDSFSFVNSVVHLPGVRMYSSICTYDLPFEGRPTSPGLMVKMAGSMVRKAHGLRR